MLSAVRSSVQWRQTAWRAAHVSETQPSSVTLRRSPDWSVSSRTIAYLVRVRVGPIAPSVRHGTSRTRRQFQSCAALAVGGGDEVVHDDQRVARPEHCCGCHHRDCDERHAVPRVFDEGMHTHDRSARVGLPQLTTVGFWRNRFFDKEDSTRKGGTVQLRTSERIIRAERSIEFALQPSQTSVLIQF